MTIPISKVYFVEVVDRKTDEVIAKIPLEVPTGGKPSEAAEQHEIISSINKELYATRIIES